MVRLCWSAMHDWTTVLNWQTHSALILNAYEPEAIESILAQSHQDFEFVIVDDGSTDGTGAILRAYAARDARIGLHFRPHRGHAQAGKACVDLAQGRWLARMDADDISQPERLATQLAFLQQGSAEVVGSSFVQQFGSERGFLWFPQQHTAIRHELLFRIGMIHGSIMLETELAKAYPYREESAHDDYEWQIRISRHQRLSNLPQILSRHRSHPGQVHVLRYADFNRDLRTYRRPHFFSLFPNATEADYIAFAKAPDREAATSLAELRLAGQWLAQLAQDQERRLREYMFNRWHQLCFRSARLGAVCFQLYQRLAPSFACDPHKQTRLLQIACHLRIASDSSLYLLLRRLKTKINRLLRA